MKRIFLLCWCFVLAPVQAALYQVLGKEPYSGCPPLYRELSFERPREAFRELPDDGSAAIAVIQQEIGHILQGRSEEGLINPGGGCIGCSSSLKHSLERQGKISTQRWEVSHSKPLKANGAPKNNVTYHYFLAVPAGKSRDEIIIDSTYLQFLSQETRAGLPRIFVGTRQDLVSFFTKHRGAIRRQGASPSGPENIDPVEFVGLTYGYEAAASARSRRED